MHTPIAAPRARNKRGEGGRLRGEILDAALEVLDESGDAGAVTLRAVARRIGISAPSIYPHFADRRSILVAALDRAYADLGRHLQGRVETAGAGSSERLLGMCHGYLDFAAANPHRYLVMFGGVWDVAEEDRGGTADREDVATLGLFLLDRLTGLLEACAADGSSRSTDPATDAVVLWVALHGLAHQRIVSTAFPWPDGIEDPVIRRSALLD